MAEKETVVVQVFSCEPFAPMSCISLDAETFCALEAIGFGFSIHYLNSEGATPFEIGDPGDTITLYYMVEHPVKAGDWLSQEQMTELDLEPWHDILLLDQSLWDEIQAMVRYMKNSRHDAEPDRNRIVGDLAWAFMWTTLAVLTGAFFVGIVKVFASSP